MSGSFLIQAAVFLAAAAIAAPLAKRLQISSVLGYLAAGVLIGPFGLGFVYAVYQVEEILHFAEYGVAMLLFLIGLELRPQRLWALRSSIFGLGAMQVLISALVITPLIMMLGASLLQAAFVGLALALSSTAFVLQVLEEKGELNTRHGRPALAVLLFQDIVAILLIAIVPFLGAFGAGRDDTGGGFSFGAVVMAVSAILLVVLVGRYLLSGLYRLVASTGVREATTASALLTLIGIVLLMEAVGLSAALGAFLAGALLAESPYRHQIEADIAPFEGLLLGLFFTAVGMGLNLHLLIDEPLRIAAAVIVLLAVKGVILLVLGRMHGLKPASARRFALSIPQGGEFAFVLFGAALGVGLLQRELTEFLSVVVTLSMLCTPLLLLADEVAVARTRADEPDYDEMPDEEGHVVIAGFGRFGQIIARILRARGIPFTALDGSAEQVAFVSRFGNTAYFGDATRLDILRAAQVDKARAFVLTLSDVDRSIKTAEIVRRHFPHVEIYARARNRRHAHQLMDLGVTILRRETFLSALDLGREVLRGLGLPEADVNHTVETFRVSDQKRLEEDHAHYMDFEKVRAGAQRQLEELEQVFRGDVDPDAETDKQDTSG